MNTWLIHFELSGYGSYQERDTFVAIAEKLEGALVIFKEWDDKRRGGEWLIQAAEVVGLEKVGCHYGIEHRA